MGVPVEQSLFSQTGVIAQSNPNSGTAQYDQMKLQAQNWQDWASRLRHFGADVMLNGLLRASTSHSNETAGDMLAIGLATDGDEEVNDRLNYRFFTRNQDDSLNEVNIDRLVELFHSKPISQCPNIMLTCNHARTVGTGCVSEILNGFTTLAESSFRNGNGKAPRINVITPENEHSLWEGDQSDKTIVMSAVFNDHNAWVNGGRMIYRMNHLDELYHQEAKGKVSDRETAYIGEGVEAMSPTSIMLAKFIEKLMVKDPSQIHLPTRADFEQWGHYEEDKAYVGDLKQALVPAGEAIELRPDAFRVLQHILPEGYSKGGQIMTDAMRFLLLDLQRPLSLEKGSARRFHVQGKPISDELIRHHMSQLGMLLVNPGKTPLNDYERGYGLRSLSLVNKDDVVIGHMISRPIMRKIREFEPNGQDDLYLVSPKRKADMLGHHPRDALGYTDADGRRHDGYLADTQQLNTRFATDLHTAHEVRSRLRVVQAATVGAVGISNVEEVPAGFRMEFSRGAKADHIQLIQQRLSGLLGDNASISCELRGPGHCIVSFAGQHRARAAKRDFVDALKKVADPDVSTKPELFVGDHIYRKLGVSAPYEEKGRFAA